ncbi:MAG: exodeoxyribonuclease VII small subunit [Burkholderiales bacterium]|nr:exodeoxyribonuclease VII small subunit [Burkholderiales bacterium]
MKTPGKELFPDIANLTFEAALEELQTLSKKMSEGGMPLAESVNAYSRGVALSKHCQKLLDDAKDKIRICDQELSKVVGEPEESNAKPKSQRGSVEYVEETDFIPDDDDIPF